MTKRAEQAAAAVLTLLAAVLHVLRFRHAGALWRDEAGAAQLAALPTLREVFESFPHEAFPLLFSTTLRTYMRVAGDSDVAFRLFGLVVGLAILAALWWNARLAGALPLASIVLMQFHPAFPLYGDSIRGYGLGTLLILLTFGAFARLVARPDRKAILLALAAAVASVHLLLHNAALLGGLCAAAAAVGVLRRRWKVALAVSGIGLAAALSLLPYTGPLASAREWRVLLIEEIALRQVLVKLAEVIGTPFPGMVWVWAAAAVVALGLTLRAARQPAGELDPREDGDGDARLFRLLAIPAALGGQIAFLIVLGYSPRIWYLLPVLALVSSSLDGLLGFEGKPAARIARTAAALGVAAVLYATAFETARMRMTNVDQVARAIEQSAGPKDLVVVNEWYYGISFHRYYRGRTRWMTVPAIGDHRMHRFDLIKVKMRSGDPLLEVRRAMRRTLRSGHRVWVVGHLGEMPEDTDWALALPPAPHGPWGWLDGPYTIAWSRQLRLFLETQTTRQRRIVVPAGGRVSGMESLEIWSFQGWETTNPRLQPPDRPGSPGRTSPGGRDTPPRTEGGPDRRGG